MLCNIVEQNSLSFLFRLLTLNPYGEYISAKNPNNQWLEIFHFLFIGFHTKSHYSYLYILTSFFIFNCDPFHISISSRMQSNLLRWVLSVPMKRTKFWYAFWVFFCESLHVIMKFSFSVAYFPFDNNNCSLFIRVIRNCSFAYFHVKKYPDQKFVGKRDKKKGARVWMREKERARVRQP